MKRRSVVAGLLVVAAVLAAGAPAGAQEPVPRVMAAPVIVPSTPPAGVAREARRQARTVAEFNSSVVEWQVAYCWQNPGHPWRCLIREATAEGHCDAVQTIIHERLWNRRTGKHTILASYGTVRMRTVYCGR